MNCKRCGYMLSSEDLFCKNCGAPVNEVNENSSSDVVNDSGEEKIKHENTFVMPVMIQSSPIPSLNTIENNSQPEIVAIESTTSLDPNSKEESEMGGNIPSIMNINSNTGVEPINDFLQRSDVIQPTSSPIPPMNSLEMKQSNDKVDSKTKIIVFGVLAFLVIIIIILLSIILFGNNNNMKNKSQENEVASSTTKYQKVDFSGFSFMIPDDIIYENLNGVLYLGDEKGDWVIQLLVEKGSYATLKKNKTGLQTYFKEAGYVASAPQEKTVNKQEFLTTELSSSGGDKALVCYSRINAMNILGAFIEDRDNEINYKLLDKISIILQSIEVINESSKLSPSFDFDVTLPSDLLREE